MLIALRFTTFKYENESLKPMADYDMICIGGGPASLSAAIYAHRFMFKVLIIAKEFGGLITKTHLVENYPGFPAVSGYDLMQNFKKHVEHFKIEIKEEEVSEAKKEGEDFSITTPSGTYTARCVVIATGTKHRMLGIPGEKEFANRGVSFCATCDATFFRDKTVAVIGGGDSAAIEALLLSLYAKKVYIIARGPEIKPEPINKEHVEKNDKIEIITGTNLTEVKGTKTVEGITLDTEYNGSTTLAVDGVFVAVGYIPLSDLAKQLGCEISEQGYIKVDHNAKTNIPKVYAAGDVTDFGWKQVITAASEGVMGAYSAYEDLRK